MILLIIVNLEEMFMIPTVLSINTEGIVYIWIVHVKLVIDLLSLKGLVFLTCVDYRDSLLHIHNILTKVVLALITILA